MNLYSRRAAAVAFILGAALIFGTIPGMGQSKDPFNGTWLLDPDRSKFSPGPAPQDRTMTIEIKGEEITHVTATYNIFLSAHDYIKYTAKFDGKDYPIIGTGIDTVSLKRVDKNTIERTGKAKGEEAEKCTMKISPDGKMLTMQIDGTYNGTDYSSTQIYTRQP
jgi:hypothetical protein